MKLFHDQQTDQTGNLEPSFGHSLNRWMWPRLAPELFDQDGSTVFVGTGTLLDDQLAATVANAKKVIIFSTGASSAQPLRRIPENWDIYCVRGPLSARQLDLPESMAIADGGLLIAQLFEAADSFSNKRQGCSFMPHIYHADEADDSWKRICQLANIRYIDPRWPVEKVLTAINSSERLMAEAIHGAIAADALRVPWIPIATSSRIYRFKWQDWCDSMNLFYHPYRLPSLKSYKPWNGNLRTGGLAIKHWIGAALEGPFSTHQYGLFADECAIAERLANIAKQAPTLSHPIVFERKLDQLQIRFSKLCHQHSRLAVM
ncbi:polysaccharide pyruvyl transferase family protein [cf. Phormidesmis sp. LEGE 11477]|uniref:polysaccharide pyruvyl transferase family protein n=1 Tax=cf. Phormidesmis sp. LEGE 11477 TaxID=1828680 RepID=UPI001881A9EF|nr:polysaccharide pyruvyl transferase family protein [cf. Phormidesmis sp. LEGE 11477]MBE9061711.1 polysaccharide pyruvyl transferase family protein [cf. Phormidesmis sp. LEGE 11477]